jgi:hypothetical protein
MAQLFVEVSDNGCAWYAFHQSKPDKYLKAGLQKYLEFQH